MTRQELITALHFPGKVQKELVIPEGKLIIEEFKEEIEGLLKWDNAEYSYKQLKEKLDPDPENLKLLLCYLEAAALAYSRYKDLGIPDNIFFSTMQALPRFLEESEKITGSYIFRTGWWAYRHLSLKIFRIGELEFELYEKDGEKFISIHIPSDSGLSSENVEYSLKKGKEFISHYFPEFRNCSFRCSSWLLSKELVPFLDENSNILSFQKRFETVSEKDSLEFLEFLFNALPDVKIEDLPEDTSLQKKVKEYLLSGGKISWTTGVLKEG